MDVRGLKDRAHELFVRGKFAKAKELFLELVRLDPGNAQAHVRLAETCQRAGDVAGARTAFERGATLAQEGRWSDALTQFELSASLRPHATTTYNIGFCERALGHPTRAKKYFKEALVRDEAHAQESSVFHSSRRHS
jgi:Tfp pilus assembly protein PilF